MMKAHSHLSDDELIELCLGDEAPHLHGCAACEARRAELAAMGFAEVDEIDSINIYWAGQLAMRRAVEGLARAPEHVLTDARRIKDVHIPQRPIVKAIARA